MVCLLIVLVACGFLWHSWRQDNRPGRIHLRRGEEFAAAHAYPQAEKEWLLGIKEDPTFPDSYVQIGDLCAQAQRWPQAEKCYTTALKYAPKDGSVWLKLAGVEQQSDRNLQAQAAARRATQLLPNSMDAARLYGVLAASNQDYPNAVASLRRAHQMNPNDRVAVLALTQTEMDASDMRGAERDVALYLRSHPEDPFACYLMAIIDNEKPQTPDTLRQGIDLAQHALPGMTGDSRIYVLLGQLYLRSHRPMDALRIYQQGIHRFPNNKQIMNGLMDGFRAVGDTQAVAYMGEQLQKATERHDRIEHLKDVMGFNPHNISAGLELARLEEEDSNTQLAQATYFMLVHTAPQDPRPRAALAAFYLRLGRPDLAKQAAKPNFVPSVGTY